MWRILVQVLHVAPAVLHVAPALMSGSSFKVLAASRHGEAEHEVDEGYDQEHLQPEALPCGIDDCRLAGRDEVENADDQDERRALEDGNRHVHEGRERVPQRLWQDDQRLRLPVAEAERSRSFILTGVYALQAATDRFRDIGGREQDQGKLRPQKLVDLDAPREKKREDEAGHEQQADQRYAPYQFDISDTHDPDHRKLDGAASQCNQNLG